MTVAINSNKRGTLTETVGEIDVLGTSVAQNCANQFVKTKNKLLHLPVKLNWNNDIPVADDVSRQLILLRQLDAVAQLLVDRADVLLRIVYP